MDNQQSGSLRMTRVTVNVPAEYSFKKNKGDCVIVDFSEGGIGIEANQIFVEGDLIRVQASLAKSSTLDCWCVVRNVQGRKIGLQFEEISNEMREHLQDYVISLLDTNKKSRYESF